MPHNMAANTWQSLFSESSRTELGAAPAALQGHLQEQGSLTLRLKARCKRGFSVQLLHQTMAFASEQAAERLGIGEGDAVLHREVLLCDGETPLVFACSLLPEAALTGVYEELRQLDERPLGHWIFAEPALARTKTSYLKIPQSDNLFVRMMPGDGNPGDCLWGRGTVYTGAAAPLYVSEFFLDAAFE